MKKYDVLVIDDKDSIIDKYGPKTAKAADKCRNLLEQRIKDSKLITIKHCRVQIIERVD